MKQPIKFIINRDEVETFLPSGSVALDFIRENQSLTGTKEGCREGECGACSVLIGELDGECVKYKAVASCLLPLGELEGKHIVTIEGINNDSFTPVQQALIDEGASQCGFCTPGFVISLTGYFLTCDSMSYDDAIDAVDGSLCRCTGYMSIRRAAQKLVDTFASRLDKTINRVEQLVDWTVLPAYFLDIPERLRVLNKEPWISSSSSKIFVAGGTDLYIQRPQELMDKDLEFISRRKELSYIREIGNWIYIGAGTTVNEMMCSPIIIKYFPEMTEYLKLVSSTIMRNRATLAGNIVNASPIGDLTIILLALRADICLVKGKSRRTFSLKDFFKGYKIMDMKKGELIESIELPTPLPGIRYYFHFEKVSQRKYLDIASCNSAIYMEIDEEGVISDIHISTGGVAPIPLYLKETCEFLRKKKLNPDNIREALKVMESEISPISDVRGSTEYKTKLLRNLLNAHFISYSTKIFGGGGAPAVCKE